MKKVNLTIEGRKIVLDFQKHFANLVKVNQNLNFGAAEHYHARGLTYVDVPEIVGITGACENVDTLFKVQSRLSLPLFFTQTGQLALEQSLQSFPGAFTVIHSGRDEEEEDERHLRQFRLTEEEFDCTLAGMTRQNYDEEKMYEALLEHIEYVVKAMVRRALSEYGAILKKEYKRDITKLREALHHNFFRVSYDDALHILQQNGYPDVRFGDDLKAYHEALIVSHLNKGDQEIPVFIMKYPKKIKFFNMKVSERDPRVVLSADLIFPYAGEGTGSAVREHDFQKLNQRLMGSTMYKLHLERGGTYEDFGWYLRIIKRKATNPHAGYGIGNERVLQYIFGARDIRHVSIFSLLDSESRDWDPMRYGQAGIITPPKHHILLTVGKSSHKRFLLSRIRKLFARDGIVFYATYHTHEFLKKYGIKTSLVYKISETGKMPNIADLLSRKVFTLVINIPATTSRVSAEYRDARLIRKAAVKKGVSLITDLEVTAMVLENLSL